MQKEQRKRAEKESGDRRNRDQDEREIEHDNNRDRKKPVRKVEGFGVNSNFASYDDKDTLKSESFMLFNAPM